MRPRMYGSTLMTTLRTRIWSSPGVGMSTSAISKVSSVGQPLGRDASRTSSAVLVMVEPSPSWNCGSVIRFNSPRRRSVPGCELDRRKKGGDVSVREAELAVERDGRGVVVVHEEGAGAVQGEQGGRDELADALAQA